MNARQSVIQLEGKQNMKKFKVAKSLMRSASLACVGCGLALIVAKPAAAAFSYCNMPNGTVIDHYDVFCKQLDPETWGGYCYSYERMRGGTCVSTVDNCAGCFSSSMTVALVQREGICSGAGSCVYNAANPGTISSMISVPSCTNYKAWPCS